MIRKLKACSDEPMGKLKAKGWLISYYLAIPRERERERRESGEKAKWVVRLYARMDRMQVAAA